MIHAFNSKTLPGPSNGVSFKLCCSKFLDHSSLGQQLHRGKADILDVGLWWGKGWKCLEDDRFQACVWPSIPGREACVWPPVCGWVRWPPREMEGSILQCVAIRAADELDTKLSHGTAADVVRCGNSCSSKLRCPTADTGARIETFCRNTFSQQCKNAVVYLSKHCTVHFVI